ncbi:MAG: sulfatase [bacterium]|nr:sulfatase [bacterium]
MIGCFLASAGVYAFAAIIRHSPHRQTFVFLGLLLPILLAELVFFLWGIQYRSEWTFFVHPLWGKIIYAFFTLLTILILSRPPIRPWLPQLIGGLLLCLVISSGIKLLSTPRPRSLTAKLQGASHPIKHVILIIDDSLRADVLSCYNPQTRQTPFIDRLAQDGILFRQAFSAAPWTLPSVSSILTGLAPSVHQVTERTSRLADSLRTLAEYMHDEGYATAAIVNNGFLAPKHNISQGFMEYNFFPKILPWKDASFVLNVIAEQVLPLFPKQFPLTASPAFLTESALTWLEAHYTRNFFLWIHYFDPHQPYNPSPSNLSDREPPSSLGYKVDKFREIRGGYFVPSLEERSWIKTLYQAELQNVDRNIGRLIETLKRLGIYDESLIIFSSDHGEEFWEHDGYEHGHSLYNEVLWVPLLIKLPQSISAEIRKNDVEFAISTQDITPTILDLCGIAYEQDTLSGTSLAPLWQPGFQAAHTEPVISSGILYYEKRESVIFDRMKYIRSLVTSRQELYDLKQDPGERHSVITRFPGKILKARDILERHHNTSRELSEYHHITEQESVNIDKNTMQQLKSLGYIQ